MEGKILKNKFKYMGIVATSLIAIAPIAVPIINSTTETIVKADDTQGYGDYQIDVKNQAPGGMILHVNVDGKEVKVVTDGIYEPTVGAIAKVPAPLLEGYVPDTPTVSFLRIPSGYRLLTDLHYTKATPAEAAASATTENYKQVLLVRNDNASYCSLYAFSKDNQISNVKNRALGNQTKWYSDKVKTYNGAHYYRVATNEWVKEEVVRVRY